MTQGMAMVLAHQMQEQGAQVNILLCDQTAAIALKGATAPVCAVYLPNTGHAPNDLREGIKPASPV